MRKQRAIYFFRNMILLILVLGLFLSRTAIAAPVTDDPPPTGDNNTEYQIGMGDVLEISVWNEEDLSKTVFVRIDGRISLPLVGDVVAAGKSPQALSRLLKEQFGKFVEDPSVSVILAATKSKRYYIVGQITKPGEFVIDYPITVLQAIARSGGFLEWAKKSRILIVRKESEAEKILTFNFDTLAKGEDLHQNIPVAPGDTIIVP